MDREGQVIDAWGPQTRVFDLYNLIQRYLFEGGNAAEGGGDGGGGGGRGGNGEGFGNGVGGSGNGERGGDGGREIPTGKKEEL